MKKTAIVSLLAFLLVVVSGNLILADEKEKAARVIPEVRAYRVNPHAPVIDGNLDDAVWSSSGVQFITDFRQVEPDEGSLPTESTVVAIIYDEDAIYVGFSRDFNRFFSAGATNVFLVKASYWLNI